VIAIVSVLITSVLLVALWWNIDIRLIASALAQADPWMLAAAVSIIFPITGLRALRFYWVAQGAIAGLGEATKLTFVSSALSLVAPAKSGDLIKSYAVAKTGGRAAGEAVAMVVFERLCDLLALIAWCVLGWAIGRPVVAVLPDAFWWMLAGVGVVCAILIGSQTAAVAIYSVAARILHRFSLRKIADLVQGWPHLLQSLGAERWRLVAFSFLLWAVHLVQMWLFTVALGAHVPLLVAASLSAVALMAGQLPLTVAGLGTRDLVLVALFAGYMPKASAAAMGILTASRNFIPPLVGLLFLRPYLSSAIADVREYRK
jgi:uncharacterized protein (TIRG00374 family)